MTAHNQLLCRRHWVRVPAQLRANVVDAWRRYRFNQLTLGELRVHQQAAIEAAK